MIGDPPNSLIAGHTGLSFTACITNLAPIVVVTLGTGLYPYCRTRLQIRPEARERVLGLDAGRSIEDSVEAKRTVPILLLTIVAFFFHNALGLEPATVALTGALDEVANGIASVTGGDHVAELLGILWASALGRASSTTSPSIRTGARITERADSSGRCSVASFFRSSAALASESGSRRSGRSGHRLHRRPEIGAWVDDQNDHAFVA